MIITPEELILTVGYLATMFSIGSFLPQVIKTMRLKKANHISMMMCVLTVMSSVLWCWYAIMVSALPLLVSQGITLLIKLWMIVLKVKYTKTKAIKARKNIGKVEKK